MAKMLLSQYSYLFQSASSNLSSESSSFYGLHYNKSDDVDSLKRLFLSGPSQCILIDIFSACLTVYNANSGKKRLREKCLAIKKSF